MFSEKEIEETLNEEILPDARAQWARLDNWRKRRNGNRTKTWMPNGADSEYADFSRKAKTPWLDFASRVIAQAIHSDAYSNAETWEKGWLATGMEGRSWRLSLPELIS